MTDLELHVLGHLEEAKEGIGSGSIFLYLRDQGVEASQSTVGRVLKTLDHRKLTRKVSNRGRILTPAGRKTLKELRWREGRRTWAENLLETTEAPTRGQYVKLLEALRLLESQVAREAAMHASAAQIAAMRRIIQKQQEQLTQLSQGGRPGITFHGLLAEACQNSFLQSAMSLLWGSSKLVQELWYDAGVVSGHSSYPHHVKIFQAVRDRNPKEAEQAMRAHFDQFIQFMKAHLHERRSPETTQTRSRSRSRRRDRGAGDTIREKNPAARRPAIRTRRISIPLVSS